MQHAIGPLATAGLALVSATAIVASPLAPPPPDLRIASPIVETTATYEDLFANTSANLSELLPALFDDPLPILSQILSNTGDSATSIAGPAVDLVVGAGGYILRLPITAVEAIQALFAEDGGLGAAVGVLVAPLLPLIPVSVELFNAVSDAIIKPFANIAAGLETALNLPNLLAVGVSAISPLIATVVATVDAVNAVVDGTFGDNASLDSAVRALIDFGPTIADGFLNGTPDAIDRTIDLPFPLPDVTLVAGFGGLLSTRNFGLTVGLGGATVSLETSGPIAGVHNYLQKIADSIAPPPPSEPEQTVANRQGSASADQKDAITLASAEQKTEQEEKTDQKATDVVKVLPDALARVSKKSDKADKPLANFRNSLKKLGDDVRKSFSKGKSKSKTDDSGAKGATGASGASGATVRGGGESGGGGGSTGGSDKSDGGVS